MGAATGPQLWLCVCTLPAPANITSGSSCCFFLFIFFSCKIFVAVAALRPAPGSGFAAARPQTRSEQLRPWRFPAEPVLQQQHRNSLFLQRCFQGLTTKGFCTKGPRAPLSVSLKSLTFLAKKGNDPAARSAGTSGFYPCHEWVMAVHGPVPDLREGEGDVMHKRPPGRPERGSETGMKILFSQASSAGAGGGGSREPRWEPKAVLGVQEEPLAPTMCRSWAFLHHPDGHSHPREAHSGSCPVFPLRLAASFIFPCPWAGSLPFQADFSAPGCLLAFAPLPAACMFGQRRVMAPARPRHCCRSWGSSRAGAKGRAGLGLLCLCCWRVGMWLQWGWTLEASCVLPQLPSLLPGTQHRAGEVGRQQELAEPGLLPPSHLSLQENRP